jgi:hypothetical protein
MTSIRLAAMGTAISASASTVFTQAGIVQAITAKAQTSSAANNGLRAFMFSSIKVVFRLTDTGQATREKHLPHLLISSIAAFSMTLR